MVWYSHLFKSFPHFIMIHTVKAFGVIDETEVDVFWNSLAFSVIQRMLAVCSLVPLPFLNPAYTSGSSLVKAEPGWGLRHILGASLPLSPFLPRTGISVSCVMVFIW